MQEKNAGCLSCGDHELLQLQHRWYIVRYLQLECLPGFAHELCALHLISLAMHTVYYGWLFYLQFTLGIEFCDLRPLYDI